MNYKQNYEDYAEYARKLNRSKGDGNLYEEHHIIPRCLDGSDLPENKVLLTPREHYLAHYLLMKIHEGTPNYRKMIYAFFMMNWDKYKTRHLNSRLYEVVKREASLSQTQLFNDPERKHQWREAWERNAAHLKDHTSSEYTNWLASTLGSIPQLRDPESLEYKEWYARMQSAKPSSKDHSSAEYLRWHEAMMQGRANKQMIWVRNLKENKDKTIDSSALESYLSAGWERGRLFRPRKINRS